MSHKPAPCAHCKSTRVGVEHIERRPDGMPLRRWAQVQCQECEARGPQIEFDYSDEWPHIAATVRALAYWNGLHGGRR